MSTSLLKLRVQVDPQNEFRARVKSWKVRMRNLNWAWATVGEAIAAYHTRVFDAAGALNLTYGGEPWRPLHELTVIARLQHAKVSGRAPYDYLPSSSEGPEGRILHWTHLLRDSMCAPKGNEASVRSGTSKSFTYGTEAPGAINHVGTVLNGRPVPARRFLDPLGGAFVAVDVLEMLFQRSMQGASGQGAP